MRGDDDNTPARLRALADITRLQDMLVDNAEDPLGKLLDLEAENARILRNLFEAENPGLMDSLENDIEEPTLRPSRQRPTHSSATFVVVIRDDGERYLSITAAAEAARVPVHMMTTRCMDGRPMRGHVYRREDGETRPPPRDQSQRRQVPSIPVRGSEGQRWRSVAEAARDLSDRSHLQERQLCREIRKVMDRDRPVMTVRPPILVTSDAHSEVVGGPALSGSHIS